MTDRLKSHQNQGFTLIELLVTTAITAIILLTASTVLMTFFLSNTRTNVRRQVKSEGTRALARIEHVARGAKSCSNSGSSLILTNLDDSTTSFYVDSTTNLIMQTPPLESLLTDFVVTGSPTLLCQADPTTGKQYVEINFNVTNNLSATSAITETFTTFVVLRNS